MEGSGSFAELELMCQDEANPEGVIEALLDKMGELGVPREAREMSGYDTLMYRKLYGKSENQK